MADQGTPSSIEIEPIGTDDGVKCPLCVDFFKSPRTLSCLHTFCQRCLELYITDLKASTKDGRIASLFCPVCKQAAATGNLQRAPKDIVSELPINELLDQTTEGFPSPGVNNWQKDKKKFVHFPQLCGFCLKDNLKVKATSYCHGCGDFRCRRCTNKHVDGERMHDFDHDVVDIEEMSAITASRLSEAINKYTMCKEHPDQELKFYCTQHELLLCRDCDVTSHMKCRLAEDFEGLSKSISQLKETSKAREELKSLQEDLSIMVETLRANNAEILKQSQSVSSKVHSMKETIIQLFEELEEGAAETIKRSREHVAKQNSGKAFKMKQLMSAIAGSCSLLDSVSEHGTHRQLFTVFQKLKHQLLMYAAIVKQEKDGLVRTSIIMDIDNDLESLISGFDKVGEVRLENSKVDIENQRRSTQTVHARKTPDDTLQADIRDNIEIPEDGFHLKDNQYSVKQETDKQGNSVSKQKSDALFEKETQTERGENGELLLSDPRKDITSAQKYRNETNVTFSVKKDSGTQVVLEEASGVYDTKQTSETQITQETGRIPKEDHAVKTPQIKVVTDTSSEHSSSKISKSRSPRALSHQNSSNIQRKSDMLTVQFMNKPLTKKGVNMDDTTNTFGTTDLHSSTLPILEMSQMETDISIMLDIPSKLIQSQELKQENPHKSRQCLAFCAIKDVIVLVFKTIKRTGISYNIVALDIETLTELKTMEIKKDPREIIAYDGRHFAITFPDAGFIDFFCFKAGTPKRKKRPANPADVQLEKSIKCDIRSAVLCKYRKEEFALSTSNYFGTLSHDGLLTKLFFYSVSLRSVETDFWRTQLSVVKLAFDYKNDVIYAATSKPFKLFAFTVFGEVLSETVLDASATSLELDKLGNVYICYNNVTDGVGKVCRVVTKMDAQREVIIENSNPRFIIFSRKSKRFHVVENKSNATRIEQYELELSPDEDTEEQDESESVATNDA